MLRPDEAMEIAETGCNSDVEILLAAWIRHLEEELEYAPRQVRGDEFLEGDWEWWDDTGDQWQAWYASCDYEDHRRIFIVRKKRPQKSLEDQLRERLIDSGWPVHASSVIEICKDLGLLTNPSNNANEEGKS